MEITFDTNKSLFDLLQGLEPTPVSEPSSSAECNLSSLEPIPIAESTNIGFRSISEQKVMHVFDEVDSILQTDNGDVYIEDINVPNFAMPYSSFWQMDNMKDNMKSMLALKSVEVSSFETKPTPVTSMPSKVKPQKSASAASSPSISAIQAGKWDERIQDLVEFKKEYDHCCVPSHWPQNTPLTQWVKRQRYQNKLRNEGQHNTLTDNRKETLDKLGFVWDPHSAYWEERLSELVAFRDENGHANVPTSYPPNPALAVWAKCQRRQFKLFWNPNAKKSNMTLDRIAKLNRFGFVFNPRDAKRKNSPRARAA